MKTIPYKFCDKTVCEVEANDALYAVHEQLLQEEKRNHWKNTRRHISLQYLQEREIDIEAPDSNPLVKVVAAEEKTELLKAISLLSEKQRRLIRLYYYEEKTTYQIAEILGVSQPAVHQQLTTIKTALKKYFEKLSD